ncbi:YceI family protein [Winogradskyella sp. HB-48]|uniref:YceI family protein n=1 Tax=Winogradskyella sp. HB-48 TaxID=3416808 RepID=UPI003CF698EC
MKQTVILFALITLCIFNSCKNEPKTNNENLIVVKEETPEEVHNNFDGLIAINVEKSIVNWKGSMLFSFGEHYGTVNFKEGSLEFKNNEIIGGSFVVDMNTIINTDGEYSEDLVNHLKNEDFFEVYKFWEAKLEFVNFEKIDGGRLKIDANLTIKGITKPMVLYNVDFLPKEKMLYTKFKIDRTDFGINYSSKGVSKFKDYAISDAVELEVELFLNH